MIKLRLCSYFVRENPTYISMFIVYILQNKLSHSTILYEQFIHFHSLIIGVNHLCKCQKYLIYLWYILHFRLTYIDYKIGILIINVQLDILHLCLLCRGKHACSKFLDSCVGVAILCWYLTSKYLCLYLSYFSK